MVTKQYMGYREECLCWELNSYPSGDKTLMLQFVCHTFIDSNKGSKHNYKPTTTSLPAPCMYKWHIAFVLRCVALHTISANTWSPDIWKRLHVRNNCNQRRKKTRSHQTKYNFNICRDKKITLCLALNVVYLREKAIRIMYFVATDVTNHLFRSLCALWLGICFVKEVFKCGLSLRRDPEMHFLWGKSNVLSNNMFLSYLQDWWSSSNMSSWSLYR